MNILKYILTILIICVFVTTPPAQACNPATDTDIARSKTSKIFQDEHLGRFQDFINNAMEEDPSLIKDAITFQEYLNEEYQLRGVCSPPYADTIFETAHVIELLGEEAIDSGTLTVAWDWDNVVNNINGSEGNDEAGFPLRDPRFLSVFSRILAGGNQQFILTARYSRLFSGNDPVTDEELQECAQRMMKTLPQEGFSPPLKDKFNNIQKVYFNVKGYRLPLYIVNSSVVFCSEKGWALKWLIDNNAFENPPTQMTLIDDNFDNIESCDFLRNYQPNSANQSLPRVTLILMHYPVFKFHLDDCNAEMGAVPELICAIAKYARYNIGTAKNFLGQATVASEIIYRRLMLTGQEPLELLTLLNNLESSLDGTGTLLKNFILETARDNANRDRENARAQEEQERAVTFAAATQETQVLFSSKVTIIPISDDAIEKWNPAERSSTNANKMFASAL